MEFAHADPGAIDSSVDDLLATLQACAHRLVRDSSCGQ